MTKWNKYLKQRLQNVSGKIIFLSLKQVVKQNGNDCDDMYMQQNSTQFREPVDKTGQERPDREDDKEGSEN